MVFQTHNFPLDSATQLADATTSAGATTNGSLLMNFGAANAYARFAVVIDWSAMDVASGSELYQFQVQGATTSAFSTAYVLAEKRLGDTTVNLQPVDTTAAGRTVIYCDNVAVTSASDANSLIATQYVRLSCVSSGTTPTVTYSAWLVPIQ